MTGPAGGGAQPARYTTPTGTTQAEIVVKNSVFVATVGHASTTERAREFIAGVSEQFRDANHNAWAYKITDGPQALIGSSDDGEPGGTAGRPMLAVLDGSGVIEIAAVVTRYFGGTKLGTGGLVRAYGGAVREALKSLPTGRRVLHHVVQVTVPYTQYGGVKHHIGQQAVRVQDETFAEDVTLELAIADGSLDALSDYFRELTNGRVWLPDALIGECYLADEQ